MDKKKYKFIGTMMLFAMIAFITYALSNPQASFPFPNSVTYIIYILYILVMGFMFRKGRSHDN